MYGKKISINIATRRLIYSEGNRVRKIYPVGVGKTSTPTPTGNYKIVTKTVNPGRVLGSRWMGLSIPRGNYGIHGTNSPSSIGGYVSNGCIRMYNHDVEELFPQVEISTPVHIFSNSTTTTETDENRQGNSQAVMRHTVQAGETLWGIAERYGKTLSQIIAVNRLSNPDLIHPGQQIIIP